jgi:hypothetical protein
MPRLLRGVARTAVVAGTATAVSGRVQRRQAERYADRDAHIYAERETAYEEQMAATAPPPTPMATPQPPAAPDTLSQLERLGALRDQGVLTDEEFADQKAKILAG